MLVSGKNQRRLFHFHSLGKTGKAAANEALGRQAVARHVSHDFAESIQFPQRRVNIRRDPKPDEFLVNDGRREDMMLAEEIAADLSLIQSFNLHVRDGAHLARIE